MLLLEMPLLHMQMVLELLQVLMASEELQLIRKLALCLLVSAITVLLER